MTHILVADDQDKIRIMLKSLFEQFGYAVTVATNGREVIRLYSANPIDIVVTDILMPDMEGIETIRELRRINPKVKIIAMSGGGTVDGNEYLRIAKMFGARWTIQKPFDVREMLDAVQQCLAAE